MFSDTRTQTSWFITVASAVVSKCKIIKYRARYQHTHNGIVNMPHRLRKMSAIDCGIF